MSHTRFDLTGCRVWVAGYGGMAGSALVRLLENYPCELLSVSRGELDLRRQTDVEEWMAEHKPEVIIIAAATVGGILANDTRPADFLHDNLAIEANIIHTSYTLGVKNFCF